MAIDRDKYQEIRKELGGQVLLVAVSKTKPVEDIRALYEAGQRDFGENYVQELVDKQPQLPADIRWHFIGHLQSNKVKYIIPFVHLIHGVDSLRLLKEIDRQAAKVGRVADVLLQVHIAREETKFGLDAAELADLLSAVHSTPAAVSAPSSTPAASTPAASAPAPASTPGSAPASSDWTHIRIRGLMGMASFSDDPAAVRQEFSTLKTLFDQYFTPAPPHAPNAAPDIAPNIAPTAAPAAASPDAGILSMGMSSDYQLAVASGSTMVRIGSLLFGKRS